MLPLDQADHVREQLAWLGRASGSLRDLDICLLSFDDHRASLGTAQQRDLEPLRGFLQQQKTAALKDLRRTLRSRRFNRLIKDLRDLATGAADSAEDCRPDAPRASLTAGQLGAERIARAYRKVLEAGAKIGAESPATALHDLRKDCKKLRYLIEFFRSFYPDQDFKSAIKVLKALQENLGTFQDFEAQQVHLRGFSRDMGEAGVMKPATDDAISALVGQLDDRQSAARQVFAERFKAFVAKDNRQLFAGLFAQPPAHGAEGRVKRGR